MSGSNYELLISFPDQSPSFVHGSEACGIWEAMKAKVPEIERTIHDENVELISQMAVRTGYSASFRKNTVEGWVDLSAALSPHTGDKNG